MTVIDQPPRKIWQNTRRFTLIEVLVAFAIAGVGTVSILGLIYTIYKTGRDATIDSRVALAANYLIDHFQYAIESDWDEYIDITDGNFAVPVHDGGVYNKDILNDWKNDAGWLVIDDLPIYSHVSRSGLYKMTFADGQDLSVRIWQSQVNSSVLSADGIAVDLPISEDVGINLALEISWPFKKVYSSRKRWYFQHTVARKN